MFAFDPIKCNLLPFANAKIQKSEVKIVLQVLQYSLWVFLPVQADAAIESFLVKAACSRSPIHCSGARALDITNHITFDYNFLHNNIGP